MNKLFFSILLCSLVLTGCAKTSPQKYEMNSLPRVDEISKEKQKQLFQYAAPWDKNLFENLYTQAKPLKNPPFIKGGIIPHHLIGGYIDASFFETIKKQKPSTIFLIGPNHFNRGNHTILSSEKDWKTPFGTTKTDRNILSSLNENNVLYFDDATIAEEHSIYSLLPFINKSLPKAKVVPIVLKNSISQDEQNLLIQNIIDHAPHDSVFVGSIDFSHYQNLAASEYHDEFTKNIIATFDFERISKLEIDSQPSLYVLLKLMEHYKTQKIAYELHDNSSAIANKPDVRDTTSYYSPYFTLGAPIAAEKTAVSILHFGDMMLDRSVRKVMEQDGFDSIFEKLAGEENRFFEGMDIVTANLEGPVANFRRQTSKSIAFNFLPDVLPTLKKYNFDLFTLANNHSYDMGKAAVEETYENLKKHGFEYYGEQYSIDEDALFIKKIGNKKVAFLGLNDTNRPVDFSLVKPLLDEANKTADHIITHIHWGQEYKLKSSSRQQKLAHQFIDHGVDIVIGHHPHVIQEMEIYNNRPIFYSLGNFVFDQYFSEPTQQGLSVGTILYDDKISLHLFPLQSERSKINLMNYKKSLQLIDRIVPAEYTKNTTKNIFNIIIPLN